jgi:hypothetical protein
MEGSSLATSGPGRHLYLLSLFGGVLGCAAPDETELSPRLVPVAYFEGEVADGVLRIWTVPSAESGPTRHQELTPVAEDRNGTRGTAALSNSIEFAVETTGSPFQGDPLGVVPQGCGTTDSASFAVTVRSFFPNGLAAAHAQITDLTTAGVPGPQHALCNSERLSPNLVDGQGALLDTSFGLVRYGNLRPRTTSISTPMSPAALAIGTDPTASTMVWKFRNGNFRFSGRVLGVPCGADACQTGFVAGEGSGVATSSPAFWEPNGTVRAIAEGEGLVYVGGDFDIVAPRTGRSARFDLASATPTVPVRPFAAVENNAVLAVAPDGAGGYYAAGTFTLVQHQNAARLVHILADGRLDPVFRPDVNGQVNSLFFAPAQNRLYLGGNFSSVGGVARSRGAAVNGTSGAVDSFVANFSDVVSVVVGDANSVYFGGSFVTVNGVARGRVAAFDIESGTLSARPFTHANGAVFAMSLEPASGRLYTAGSFQVPSNRIGAWDTATGAQLAGFRAVSSANVQAVVATPTAVFIGGGATFSLNGLPRQGLGAIDPTTGATLPFSPVVPGAVRAVARDGTTLLLGGAFLAVNGSSRDRLASLDITNISAPVLLPFAPTASNTVRTLAIDPDRRLFVGTDEGPYIGGVRRTGVVALDLSSGRPTDFVANVAGDVDALAVDGSGNLIVGGDFTLINGISRSKLASVSPDGAVSALNPLFDPLAQINAIVASGDDVVVGGSFSAVNGQPQANVAKLSNTGGIVPGFGLVVNGAVHCLDIDNGDLLVGGGFSLPGSRLVIADEDSGVLLADLGANGEVFGAAFNSDAIYATGAFSSVLGQGTGNVAAINRSSETIRWVRALGGTGLSIAPAGNGIVVAGSVGTTGVAELSARTGAPVASFDEFGPLKAASTLEFVRTVGGFTFVGRAPTSSIQVATPGVPNSGGDQRRAQRSSFIGAHAN